MPEVRPYLRDWRKLKKLSQDFVANKLETDRSTLSRYESGEIRVDDATFARIAELYGITPAELSAPPTEAARARQLHRIFSAVQHVDEPALKLLADMAEQLRQRA